VLIDTHCHLDAAEFDPDRDEVVEAAQRAGVGCILMPAVHRANFSTVARLAASRDGLCYALGIHPLAVDQSHEADLLTLRDRVRASLSDPRFVAIGEIGLDHFVPGLDRDRQERFYVAQLQIAREFDLPVLLHLRRAQDQVLKHLRRLGVRQGIAHAFNGSQQQADALVSQGLVLGLGGALTWPRALQIRRLVRAVPEDGFVLETDAPDIPPIWRGRERNTPDQLPQIAACVADLREASLAQVIAASTAAACRVLPRLSAGLKPTQGSPPDR
jgi:TatD DNase family protein